MSEKRMTAQELEPWIKGLVAARQNGQRTMTFDLDTAARLLQLAYRQSPLEPTPEMIEAGAQRLVSWTDDAVWPDSWVALQLAAARNEAERVWRSMWLECHREGE
jgi:hypothetical protein